MQFGGEVFGVEFFFLAAHVRLHHFVDVFFVDVFFEEGGLCGGFGGPRAEPGAI